MTSDGDRRRVDDRAVSAHPARAEDTEEELAEDPGRITEQCLLLGSSDEASKLAMTIAAFMGVFHRAPSFDGLDAASGHIVLHVNDM